VTNAPTLVSQLVCGRRANALLGHLGFWVTYSGGSISFKLCIYVVVSQAHFVFPSQSLPHRWAFPLQDYTIYEPSLKLAITSLRADFAARLLRYFHSDALELCCGWVEGDTCLHVEVIIDEDVITVANQKLWPRTGSAKRHIARDLTNESVSLRFECDTVLKWDRRGDDRQVRKLTLGLEEHDARFTH